MRLLGLTLWLLLWAVPVTAQTATIAVGQPFTVKADHDGADTLGYRLTANGATLAEVPVSALAAGTVTLAGTLATPGAYTLRVIAFNAVGATPGTPEPMMQAGQQATLQPCPYTSPAGVTSIKPIGDTSVQGWNTYDFSKLADVQRFATRFQQLFGWGFTTQVTQLNKPKNQVYIIATCVGIAAAAAPVPTGRQSIPPQSSITAPDGVWTLQGVQLIRNGSVMPGAGTELVLVSGVLYTHGTDGNWYRWTGTAWSSIGTVAP